MALKSTITVGTIFTIVVLLASFLYKKPYDDLQLRLRNVLSGLKTIEEAFEINNPKVAVGYGACRDIVIDGKHMLTFKESLAKPIHHDVINTWEQLYNAYCYYFMHGAAAERYTSNLTLFNELVSIASKLKSSRSLIGGNAAVIARRLYWEGCDVILGTTVTPTQKKMLPPGLKFGKETEKDDVHLVFEYKADEKWGPYIAPRANRFILHSDVHNPRLSSLEEFGKKLKGFNPRLLIISGIQMMDNYPLPNNTKRDRLKEVKGQMNVQSLATKIHFEMASVTEQNLLSLIFENIIPYTDSIGMNEQELANFYSVLSTGNITLATDSIPKVGKTLDLMRYVYDKIRGMKDKKLFFKRQLTRIHVHTLAYQVIMVDKLSSWKNTHISAAKASLVANRYICDTEEIKTEKSKLVMDESFSISAVPGSRRIYLDEQNPVSCWDEQSVLICIAPNLVCTKVKQTAGGGDNISAAGLAAHLV